MRNKEISLFSQKSSGANECNQKAQNKIFRHIMKVTKCHIVQTIIMVAIKRKTK